MSEAEAFSNTCEARRTSEELGCCELCLPGPKNHRGLFVDVLVQMGGVERRAGGCMGCGCVLESPPPLPSSRHRAWVTRSCAWASTGIFVGGGKSFELKRHPMLLETFDMIWGLLALQNPCSAISERLYKKIKKTKLLKHSIVIMFKFVGCLD